MRGENVSTRTRLARVASELDAMFDDATKQVWSMIEASSRWGQRTLAEISQSLNRAQSRASRAAH